MLLLLSLVFTTTLAEQTCVPTIDDPSNPVNINAVVFPFYAACAAVEDGKSKCWGRNGQGQLGLGDTNNRGDEPNEMGDNLPYTQWVGDKKVQYLAADVGNRVLAYMEDGTVQGMGWNDKGQLCQGDNTNRLSPVEIPLPSVGTKALMTAGQWSCILANDDKYYCWGNNVYGQCGVVRDDGMLGRDPDECGDNLEAIDFGTLAYDGVTPLPPIKQFAMGGSHGCVLFEDSTMKCWGSNTHGVLGINTGYYDNKGDDENEMGDYLTFVNTGDFVPKRIELGQSMSCIITTEDRVVCWGWAQYLAVDPRKTITLQVVGLKQTVSLRFDLKRQILMDR
jgi:hypothetical protein